ncbi:MAG: hypothetical protein DLM58_10370 [Pseudonocardiales bacterium]|nr:MAG: hypothetical protein DLM58_10370 [Pseudonocardiales bacterium]
MGSVLKLMADVDGRAGFAITNSGHRGRDGDRMRAAGRVRRIMIIVGFTAFGAQLKTFFQYLANRVGSF